jgi:hypothetical protein
MGNDRLEIITTRDGSEMKSIKKFLPLLLLLLLLTTSFSVVAAQAVEPPPPINEDKVVIGQTFILQEDQVLNGDLAIIGSTAILKDGSKVNGNIALIGGVLRVNGTVTGDIQALGGTVELMEAAIVQGSLFNFSSNLSQDDGAVINGQQISSLPFEFNFGNFTVPENPNLPLKTVQKATSIIGNFIWSILQILALAALAMLVILLAQKSTDRIATSIVKQPFVHWGIGLLSVFSIPAILAILMITIILIPISLVGFIIFAFSLIYGWIALGYAIGKRLFSENNHNLSPAVVAGIGTLIITIIARLAAMVPCVGWTVGAILSLFGLGAIVLTRFGTRDYPVEITTTLTPPIQSSSFTNLEDNTNLVIEADDIPDQEIPDKSLLD